ncbi:MAG: aldehyde dehydrogenase [Pirellulaceae bacterium]|nr:aldehyde dehydrogenase [Pirellulaceae bacterium]
MTIQLPVALLPETEAFLGEGILPGVVAGEDVMGAGGDVIRTVDPGSGIPLAEVTAMQAEDVDRAVRAAREAFETTGWPKLSPNRRGAMLLRLADEVENRKAVVAQIEALDTGKIIAQAEWDVQNFIDCIRYYVEMALHVERRSPLAVPRHEASVVRLAWGPCGFIFPWNFPFMLMGWNLAPAMAAGNTAVVKPAEDTPLSAIYLARLAREVGIPDGVLNVVPGYGDPVGAALASHPGIKRMSFTGSPEVGRLVGAACGRNLVPVKLELGGKGAAVIFDDVDISQTVESLAQAITFHAGQVCCDATRWLIHRPIYDEFAAAAVERLGKVKIGYQFDGGTELGPLVSRKQCERVLGYMRRGREEGASLLLEGGPAEVAGLDGCYVKPALLAGSLDNVAAREEIFGPVAYLTPFKDETEAVQLANQTDYGLANSVWTKDLARAERVAQAMVAGSSWINAHNVIPLGIPYAGVNKSGMGGGVLSEQTLLDYWRNLSVVRPL